MHALLLIPAMLLDGWLGEPRWVWGRWPHPAVLMGRAVAALDGALNRGARRKMRGAVAVAVLVLGAGALGRGIASLPFGWMWEILGAAILMAQRSLADHVQAVGDGLRLSLAEGRRMVGRIVGRDTAAMDEPAAARAAVESAAENLSDGVVAPALWFLIGGLPGILVYKVVNTADSMIGHRTPRHEQFGWAAARLDDVLNLIPARLTAVLLALAGWRPDAGRVVLRDAPRHRSPNAGWPEAAMAVVLGIAVSGPRSYHGVMTDQPYVHPEGRRDAGPDDIDAAVRLLWRVWALLLVGIAMIAAALAG
ncbi:adenosylcobinamide-phosphate synthase [Gemmobacter megaterium]|uniref:Cobalamin biosynthesis protein CobD n=1 Tax=Gemmobacter megaterium TaxID=1086013 RepID=A0A1N7Q4F0_9RHOB|nr:adenosylcobinamide-phosphate synthase CbiB [Gemmobacter megaterium]GGE22924.1 cobalamin biosynthesis protein CobD [Gemmobacter megaterium]SIT17742.1 adenosylcobinamide-phosphate synthase [Gemmobacter megaterium]